MEKTTRIWDEELNFVRRYCHNGSFPASDQRCPYAKAKIRAGFVRVSKINGEVVDKDAMFLCRYPDARTPLHQACLIAEMVCCPDDARRREIDAQ